MGEYVTLPAAMAVVVSANIFVQGNLAFTPSFKNIERGVVFIRQSAFDKYKIEHPHATPEKYAQELFGEKYDERCHIIITPSQNLKEIIETEMPNIPNNATIKVRSVSYLKDQKKGPAFDVVDNTHKFTVEEVKNIARKTWPEAVKSAIRHAFKPDLFPAQPQLKIETPYTLLAGEHHLAVMQHPPGDPITMPREDYTL